MWEGAFEQHARVCILIKSWLPRGAWNSKKGNKSTQWHKILPLAKCECKSTIISERAQCQLWPAGKGMENSVPLLPVIFRATLRRALMCLDAQIYGFNGHRTCPPTASSLDNEGAVAGLSSQMSPTQGKALGALLDLSFHRLYLHLTLLFNRWHFMLE